MEKKILFTQSDVPEVCSEKSGEFPFTRGIHQSMYTKKVWTMRQYAGFGDARASNRRYRYLLSQGTTGLSVAFDLPTQMGYDSDDVLSKGEVGRVGVAISSLEDIALLFEGIPLDSVSTSMTINATAAILLCFYAAIAERQGVDRKKLRGTVQNDILKEYMARGTYIFPPKPSLKLTTDMLEFCHQEMPEWNTVSVSGYHIREAGSTAVQEVAFTLSDGLVYVDAALKRGLSIDDLAPRISFFFNVHNHFLEEVAKFRAARRLWARLIRERYQPKKERSMMLRFHAQTAGSTLISTQIDTNVVRVTLQAMAAVLGGAQSLHTNSRDEALSLPTEDAALLALRTQQIIAHETGVTEIVDPLGGSYAIEALTCEIENKTLQLINEIETRGGVVKCIEQNYQQSLIAEAAYAYQKDVENKKRIVVGLNEFTQEKTTSTDILKIDDAIEKEQIERLKAYKTKRDHKRLSNSMNNLKQAAEREENVVPKIFEVVKDSATLGEIVKTLVGVYGRYEA